MNWSFLAGVALTAITFIPALQQFFGTTMLSGAQFAIAIGFAFAIIPVVEIQKLTEFLIKRRKNKKIEMFKEEQKEETEEQN
jgi:hypothetical protein